MTTSILLLSSLSTILSLFILLYYCCALSWVVNGNPFLALIYPFFTTDNGICTNILKTEVFFKFLLPLFPKDIHLLKEISISKDKSDDEIPTMADLVIDDDEIPTMVDNTILPSSSST